MFKFTCRLVLGLALLGLVLLSAQAPVFADMEELEAIKRAIDETGASWKAGDNWRIRLTKDQREGIDTLVIRPDTPMDRPVTILPKTRTRGSLDWTDKDGENWVTVAKNQGECGSCTFFSNVGMLESGVHINENLPVTADYQIDLSEQYVMSCCRLRDACNGSNPDMVNDFLLNMGAPDEDCMPYAESAKPPYCDDACSDHASRLTIATDWIYITNYYNVDIDNIKAALQNGPVATTVGICDDLNGYEEGIYHHVYGECPYYNNHAVLIVGYSEGNQYWKIKNSWGTAWGEGGFFRIRWEDTGAHLGLATTAMTYGEPLECADDAMEGNNTMGTATAVANETYSGLSICAGDEDYYRVDIPGPSTLASLVSFSKTKGELMMDLLDSQGEVIHQGTEDDGGKVIEEQQLVEGTYYLHVYPSGGEIENYYMMQVDLELPCVPDCEGKECGVDGCDGFCGNCTGDKGFCIDFMCVGCRNNIDCSEGTECINHSCLRTCAATCDWRECGDYEGCTCGTCPAEEQCEEFLCVEPTLDGDGTDNPADGDTDSDGSEAAEEPDPDGDQTSSPKCLGSCDPLDESFCIGTSQNLCKCDNESWSTIDCQAACQEQNKSGFECTQITGSQSFACSCYKTEGDDPPDPDGDIVTDGDSSETTGGSGGLSGGSGCAQTGQSAALLIAVLFVGLLFHNRRRRRI